MMMFNKSFGSIEESNRDARNKNGAEEPGKNHSDQVQPAVLVPDAVAKHAPAEPGNDSNLFCQSVRRSYVSHESSSSCERSAPWPTTERKISSSVSVRPSTLGTPARSSAIEPCATSWPFLIIPTWLHSRSTISRT